MKANRFVSIEKPEHGIWLVKKSKGELSITNITDALRDENTEDDFILHLRATVFDGYLGEDTFNCATLFNISQMDNCPVCQKKWEELHSQLWEEAFKAGIESVEKDNPS